jgi:hypothetical protein
MTEALCGPSNPLQNFRKHTAVDRTLQQDRVAQRASTSQVHHSLVLRESVLTHFLGLPKSSTTTRWPPRSRVRGIRSRSLFIPRTSTSSIWPACGSGLAVTSICTGSTRVGKRFPAYADIVPSSSTTSGTTNRWLASRLHAAAYSLTTTTTTVSAAHTVSTNVFVVPTSSPFAQLHLRPLSSNYR